MNIARASPFNYRNGRIRSSRRQLCWLYCDSMQIPPTAILQPIARTISSIVFPASPDRATNRKNDRFIAFYSWTVIPLYILLHNPHHPAFVVLIAASFYTIHTHTYICHQDTFRKSCNWNRFFVHLDISSHKNCERIHWFIFFPRNAYTISKNCPEIGLGQSEIRDPNIRMEIND